MSKKNSSDTIGNRTRDLPVCGAVPQPTAPPRTPDVAMDVINFRIWHRIDWQMCIKFSGENPIKFYPENGGQMDPPKHWYISALTSRLHTPEGTSQDKMTVCLSVTHDNWQSICTSLGESQPSRLHSRPRQISVNYPSVPACTSAILLPVFQNVLRRHGAILLFICVTVYLGWIDV